MPQHDAVALVGIEEEFFLHGGIVRSHGGPKKRQHKRSGAHFTRLRKGAGGGAKVRWGKLRAVRHRRAATAAREQGTHASNGAFGYVSVSPPPAAAVTFSVEGVLGGRQAPNGPYGRHISCRAQPPVR